VVRRHLLPGLAALGVLLAAAPPAQAALRFERCGGYGYSCARLSVPLDHAGAVPGRVSLRVQRLRSRMRPARGAVIVLAGGPGESATAAFAGDGIGLLYPAYRSRDVIVFDQRGTGLSGPLRCPGLERADLLDAGEAAAACARRIGPRRAFYTTPDTVEDVEAIRRALGVGRVALYGTSYGTKVALAYALRYPARVERMALDSLLDPAGPDPFYRDSVAATPRALRSVCRGACRSFTRDPVADLQALVDRMRRRGPLRGRVVDVRGRRHRAALRRAQLFAILLAGDFDPSLRAAFPGSVRAARRGDAAPLLRLRRRALAVGGDLSPHRLLSAALYATTTCEETTFPWPRSSPPDPGARRAQARVAAASLPASAFAPFDRGTLLGTDLLALCERWPVARADAALAPGPLPDVPVLLLEGEDDLRTPVEGARRVAAGFPRSTLVVSAATGHSALGSDPSRCARRAFDRFFRGGPVPSRCRAVRRRFSPRPPPPVRLAEVARLPGVRGRRGRVLTAVGLTLRDVLDDSFTRFLLGPVGPDLARGGGLRRGAYRIGGRGTLVLRGLAFVPGVRISGRIRRFGERRQRGRVRVAGPGVPAGLLAVRGRRLRGSLAGRRVRARLHGLAAPAAVAAAVRPQASSAATPPARASSGRAEGRRARGSRAPPRPA
jgi:pimeloyl-ACP methyl ester carboxylesterase